MASKVPGPQGRHPSIARPHVGHAKVYGAGTVPGHAQPVTAAHTIEVRQHADFHLPTDSGPRVRSVYTFRGEPVCEVWLRKQRVAPPPRLIARNDPKNDDSFYREGDTLFAGDVSRSGLRGLGFRDAEESVFTALLFFLLDIDTDDEYSVIWVFRKIYPDAFDQWNGRVVFDRFLVAGSTIIPLPHQPIDKREDLKDQLLLLQSCDLLAAFQKLVTLYIGVLIDILWGLTGGWEAKVAVEVTEKYVAREVLRRALEFMRPKFLAVVKAYVEAFVKELVRQIFQRALFAIRSMASDTLTTRTGSQGDTITIDQIHWLQSSNALTKVSDQASIDWWKCQTKGMEEALAPFWKLFAGIGVVNGPFRRFVEACFGYVKKFFFDLGLRRVIEKVEGPIGNKIRTDINKLVAEVVTDWVKEVASSPKGMTAAASEQKVRELTVRKLTDGTIVELAFTYINDNWEKLAASAIDKAETELIKAIKGADKGNKTKEFLEKSRSL